MCVIQHLHNLTFTTLVPYIVCIIESHGTMVQMVAQLISCGVVWDSNILRLRVKR